MFEGMFKRRKVVNITPEQTQAAVGEVYHSGNQNSTKEDEAEDGSHDTAVPEEELPTPSQSSGERISSNRAVEGEFGWDFNKMNRGGSGNSWKVHRDTPYRPEA